MMFIEGKCFRFYLSDNPVNGEGLHWIQPHSAEAYDTLQRGRISANHMLSNCGNIHRLGRICGALV